MDEDQRQKDLDAVAEFLRSKFAEFSRKAKPNSGVGLDARNKYSMHANQIASNIIRLYELELGIEEKESGKSRPTPIKSAKMHKG